jgi:aerobic carbon-monoxide dehydrogenase large subunit
MANSWFGASVKRKEDPAFLTGKGQYVDDIVVPGMLFAAMVRSPFAHAMINSIDKSAAQSAPGVHAVFCFEDLPEPLQQAIPLLVPNPAIKELHMPYVLAKDEVCYAGEPVAIVVAESRYLAEDAALLVEVDYSPLPAISDCRRALEPGCPPVHGRSPSNVVADFPISVGNVEAAFAAAPHVFKETLYQHRGGPFFMECRGFLVIPDPVSDLLTIYVSSQGSHRQKRIILEMLGLDDNLVRVITPDVGGGFGPKGAFYPEYGAAIAVAQRLRRPVKWIEDRRENFLTTHQERDQFWDVEIAVDDNAKILGVRGRLLHEAGAFIPWGVVLPWISATTVPGPYIVPNYQMQVVVALTNKISTTPVRGAGRPQAVFVMERLMDRVARELKLDRAEVRRRNFIQPSQMPYPVGILFRDGRMVTYDSGDYPSCQAEALRLVDYDGFRARQEAARREGRYIGLGISNAVEGTGLGPYESATIRVASNGRITLYTGATPQGQSHKTTLAQIAADQLGASPDDINVVTADTGTIGLGMGTFAARTAVNAGSSVHLAGIDLCGQLKAVAADMLDVTVDEIDLKDGWANVRGMQGVRKSFKELAIMSIGMPGSSIAGGRTPGLEATKYFTPAQSVYSNGTHIAEVEVDIATGNTTVLNYMIVHDCGRVINPMVVEGQVVGGVVHGIGNAFFERMIYDDNAQPLSTNFGEYLLPTANETPKIEVHHQETPSPFNPLGMKGAGEGGTIASIAALIGATEDALSIFGVTLNEAPVSPQRIVELLGDHAFGESR